MASRRSVAGCADKRRTMSFLFVNQPESVSKCVMTPHFTWVIVIVQKPGEIPVFAVYGG